jgi:hypothetical protein
MWFVLQGAVVFAVAYPIIQPGEDTRPLLLQWVNSEKWRDASMG